MESAPGSPLPSFSTPAAPTPPRQSSLKAAEDRYYNTLAATQQLLSAARKPLADPADFLSQARRAFTELDQAKEVIIHEQANHYRRQDARPIEEHYMTETTHYLGELTQAAQKASTALRTLPPQPKQPSPAKARPPTLIRIKEAVQDEDKQANTPEKQDLLIARRRQQQLQWQQELRLTSPPCHS